MSGFRTLCYRYSVWVEMDCVGKSGIRRTTRSTSYLILEHLLGISLRRRF